ncbi:MAG: TonB-dependent receptor [Bacteroidetes bacterium]|jgi:outer membrane receptor for ferrienterochelin and colicin|nr:TonB-dependent receptor [Bacteroidota bacterium]
MKQNYLFTFLFSIFSFLLHAQSTLEVTLDFNVENLSLEDALFELIDQSEVNITFNNDLLPSNKTFNLRLQNASVGTILKELLKGTNLSFRTIENQIAIFERKNVRPQRKFIISGFIENAESGERIIGAGVYDNKTKIGVYSNEYGFFSLTLPEGEVELTAAYLGYQNFSDTLQLTSNTLINLSLQPTYLQEIVVQEKNDTLIIATPDLNTDIFSIENVQKMPSLGGESDVIRMVHLMPGIQVGSDGVGGISVRGGDVDQNLFLLDGVPVYNPYHAIGIYSIFNSNAIRSAKLIRGPFPAKYGGRISSVLDIQTKEGNMKESQVEMDLGLTSLKLSVQGPLKKDKSSFFISGRQALFQLYSVPISTRIREADGNDGFISYSFFDLNIKVNQKLSEKDHLYASYYKGSDSFVDNNGLEFFSQPDTTVFFIDDEEIFWGNEIASLRWNHVFNQKLFANTTFMLSRYFYEAQNKVSIQVQKDGDPVASRAGFIKSESNNRDLSGKIDFDYQLNENHFIEFGLNAIYHRFQLILIQLDERVFPMQTTLDTIGNSDRNSLDSYEFDTYVQDNWNLGEKWNANIGLRVSAMGNFNKTYYSLQPRFQIAYTPNPIWAFSAAAGRMTQHLHLLSPSNNISGLPKDLWVNSTDKVKPQQSWQFVIGLQKKFRGNIELKLDGYYKYVDNLINFNNVSLDNELNSKNWDSQVFEGRGWSYGSELFLQKQGTKFLAWISYTLSWSKRQFSEEINRGRAYPFRLDRRHNFNTAFLYKLNEKIEFSANWLYASGSALTYPTQSAWYYLPQTQDFPYQTIFSYNIANSKNNARFKPYHRLDLALNLNFKVRKLHYLLKLGVYNTYVRLNPVYADFNEQFSPEIGIEREEKQVSLLPIFPSLRLHIRFL